MATNITDAELQQMLTERLSQTEITRRTGIPRSTLRRRIGKLNALNAYLSNSALDQDPEANADLRELLEWWNARKRALQIEADTEQETERKTYHVQKRYIEAIQRAADLERVSITEIVNRAFQKFFDEGA